MPHAPSRVHLIVAADYGERLRSLPVSEGAWVADTTTNHPVIKSIWAARPAGGGRGHLAGVTSFQVVAAETPEDWLLGILDAVDLHHGEHSQTPPYSELRVVGTPLSARLRAELAEFGFIRYEDSSDGFVAYKLAA
jgi:hypothetical protein